MEGKSGLYVWERSEEETLPGSSISADCMELRLDVDGDTPLMKASGTARASDSTKFHWIASLTADGGQDRWKGCICYKHPEDEETVFPYDTVAIKVAQNASSMEQEATLAFSNATGLSHDMTFEFRSLYFHTVNIEFDFQENQREKSTTKFNTHAHSNRPEDLPRETLKIETVFERSGFCVTPSDHGEEVPLEIAEDEEWSDEELHDAMQEYWSLFPEDSPKAQWALWFLFASEHENSNLSGIMFDDIGEQHRQGAAIFNDGRLDKLPSGESEAWRERKKFFYACHEIGHCFNLAHSWEKESTLETPWVHQENEPEARSFMNYPSKVEGEDKAFFRDFRYRFSESELIFMRHAPQSFVEMGNAVWFDNHAFEEGFVTPAQPSFLLELRVNRENAVFEFMEPVTLELKLTNISGRKLMVEENLLSTSYSMFVVIKRDGRHARRLIPFARYENDFTVKLKSKKSLYESLFVSAGINGWDIKDPGKYLVQVALHHKGEDIISNEFKIHVLEPQNSAEKDYSRKLFCEDVGRVLYFGGSGVLETANSILRDAAKNFKDRKIAMHASVALGSALSRNLKHLVLADQEKGPRFKVMTGKAKTEEEVEEAQDFVVTALISRGGEAVESFGHINYKRCADQLVDWLDRTKKTREAAESCEIFYGILSTRKVQGRPIRREVIKETKKRLKKIRRNNKKGWLVHSLKGRRVWY